MNRSAPTLSCQNIDSVAKFELMADAWQSLYERALCTSPSLSHAAVRAFILNRLPAEEHVAVLAAWNGATLVGALPLVTQPASGAMRLATFSDVHTYGVEPLLDPVHGSAALQQILEFALSSHPKLLSLRLVDVRCGCVSMIRQAATGTFLVHAEVRRKASYFSVPGPDVQPTTWLSANFRKNLRKQETRLRSLGQTRFEIVQSAVEPSATFERFLELEASGWKGREGTAILASEALRRHYDDLLSGLGAVGYLEWHLLWARDQLLAAHMAVRVGRTVSLLKIAYDEAYAAYGPGNMLMLELLRREWKAQTSSEIDCLTDMTWHRKWRMPQREYFTVTLYPKQWGTVLRGYLPAVMKDAIRRIPVVGSTMKAIRKLVSL